MAARKSVALALGSGSSRGWAHIGVLEALAEENISIDCIVGSSIGSYVGALYACGKLSSLKEFVLRMDGKKVFSYFDVVFPRSGLLDGTKRLKELFSMHTDVEGFSELNLQVVMVATDLHTGGRVVLKSGSLFDALRATMSIPGLFAPACINNRWLVDGGLVDPVPVGIARAMSNEVVIAVDLNSGLVSRKRKQIAEGQANRSVCEAHEPKHDFIGKMTAYYETAETGLKTKINELLHRESSTPDIFETVISSIHIMQERITRINLAVEPPDVLVQPRLGQLKMLDFDQVDEVIEEGYLAVKEKREDILALLEPAADN
jgi:NTE family protein